MVLYRSVRVKACCPIQYEAMALKVAVDMVLERGITSCLFMSDCKTLIDLVSGFSPPLNADWRAFTLVQSVWNSLRLSEILVSRFIQRCQNDLADQLAKMGRLQGWDLTEYTLPMLRELQFYYWVFSLYCQKYMYGMICTCYMFYEWKQTYGSLKKKKGTGQITGDIFSNFQL